MGGSFLDLARSLYLIYRLLFDKKSFFHITFFYSLQRFFVWNSFEAKQYKKVLLRSSHILTLST